MGDLAPLAAVTCVPYDAESVVDIGCGRGKIGFWLRSDPNRRHKRLVGVDIHRPSLEFCRYHRIYDELVEHDLNVLPLPFKGKEFNVLVALQLIEHFTKEHAVKILDEFERISEKIIITTPRAFGTNIEHAEEQRNPYMLHRSVWSPSEFRRRGYKVRGVGSLDIRIARRARLANLAASPLWLLPELSSQLLVKNF